MSIYAHIDALNEKHQHLSQAIKEAYRHHDSDMRLQELKRERLQLEEEIERFYGMARKENVGNVA